MMQLASAARKRLSSARALRQTTEQLIKTVRKLRKDLEDFKCSVERDLCLDNPRDTSRVPAGLNLRQAQSLQSHYFCLVLDVNTPLTYPWLGISTYLADDAAAASHVETSYNAVAQASRSGILATRQVHVDGGCSNLIAKYTPVYCFMNLFIHILRDTTAPTVSSDLVLLDIAFGYFSNLEFVTGLELSRILVRDLCHLARLAVKHNAKGQDNNTGQMFSEATSAPLISAGTDLVIDPADFDDTSTLPFHENDFFGFLPDEDLESWSTLVPLNDVDDMMF
ncbi:hypothetical protein LTS07_004761 [Exophiala sideris]|uniref:Uncharacterized protein n=1 Tax=Exophiala sideris TaxID=1016849 RepID=A0ABR0JBG5_9EURO|nr:hypothetical protein LTS07_004761 [Exophiala sideris]KAK5038748.1 hypothetical protein LTR13_003779 [Exophiala sideris]KAK5060631.1 hypothetical protein LTR69_005230 [Exophiala sideris]KAK5183544.1 hypothetical protein LTR44_003826 [Eurotiomycetes sp. CCFEE 6388]